MFQSRSVKLKSSLTKKAECTCWYPMFSDRKHSFKIAVLLLFDTMIIIWLNNIKHYPRIQKMLFQGPSILNIWKLYQILWRILFGKYSKLFANFSTAHPHSSEVVLGPDPQRYEKLICFHSYTSTTNEKFVGSSGIRNHTGF